MNIQWVLADDAALDPTVDLEQLKNIGSFWGSWRTWRAYNTDNVICYDGAKATELYQREFHKIANFYVHDSTYQQLSSPQHIRVFGGSFSHQVTRQDEIVAMNLTSSLGADVILLVGFNWTETMDPHYLGIVHHTIKSSEAQWVLLDHPHELAPQLAELDNLTSDTLDSVVKLLLK